VLEPAFALRPIVVRSFARPPPRPLQRLWQALLEMLGAGALAKLLGGYGSHVALDALTPTGPPLFA